MSSSPCRYASASARSLAPRNPRSTPAEPSRSVNDGSSVSASRREPSHSSTAKSRGWYSAKSSCRTSRAVAAARSAATLISRRRLREPARKRRGCALDVPREAERDERAQDEPADVELAAADAVVGHRGERVVVVVPALPEREHGDQPVVAAVVARVEAPRAEEVADRVDCERDVIGERDPHRAAPQKPLPAVERVRDDETDDCPEHGGPVDE